MTLSTEERRATAMKAKAWPFEEAAKLVRRVEKTPPEKAYVVFETGYGPSGLPHIGTFMEVFRTTLVQHAFEQMSDIPTRLLCISDDMDGMRKVPDNLPNADMLAQHLQLPLTQVPDPFGTHESYGAHMNAKLQRFLDHYRFNYEFKSATDLYKTGIYDEKLLLALKKYDDLMKVMLPTLGAERQATYSPFLPLSPKTGRVLYVPLKGWDAEQGTITFDDEDGTLTTVPVTGGHCKLQWKPDFGMRWAALGVDYEMFGKDHQPSAPLYSKICEILEGTPPEQYVYEMFLDAEGQKISKSKGNGLTIEEWLRYAPPESLAYYMFLSPRKAKRLHFDVIPKAVDEYLTFLAKYPNQTYAEQLENPVWHIHAGNPPAPELSTVTFNLLLNLVSACNAGDASVLWGFISRYAPQVRPETCPMLDQLVGYAVAYYQDFVKPAKKYRAPNDVERAALSELSAYLETAQGASAEDIQTQVYEIGKTHGFSELRAWFGALYEILLGQPQGPRMGSFIALYGAQETRALIERVLKGESLAA